ncbi:PREDICTED: LOC110745843, partial [Prunus dulcis]
LVEVEEVPEHQTPTAKTGGTAMKLTIEQLCFSKPTEEMANHLRPLFITANFGGIPILKVMVDG